MRLKWAVKLTFVLAALFLGVSVLLFLKAPIDIEHQRYWGTLKDIGPAIAGSWVVVAALLAITAAGLSATWAQEDAKAGVDRRVASIRRACIGEVQSLYERINALELPTKLADHIAWLELCQDELGQHGSPNVFRRHLGDDWFLLSRVDPLAISELGVDECGAYLSLSGRARGVVSRFNWLNGINAGSQSLEFWIKYHNDTREELNELKLSAASMLKRLGDEVTDVSVFRFA